MPAIYNAPWAILNINHHIAKPLISTPAAIDQTAKARKIGSVSFKLSFAFVALESIKEGGCSGSLSLLESCQFKFFEFNGNVVHEKHYKAVLKMRDLSLEEIQEYVEKDDPLMSSGSYKYESLGKDLFEYIKGDPYVIQGLPLEASKGNP